MSLMSRSENKVMLCWLSWFLFLQLGRISAARAEHYYEKAPYYQFGYQVKDEYSGHYLGHTEHNSGDLTTGEFKVQLPDGRVQVTSYVADDYGYRPTISYHYPEQINKQKMEKMNPRYYLLSMMKNGVTTKYVVLNKNHHKN